MKKRYSPAFKALIVRDPLKEEKSVSQLAAEHGLHPNQLYRWRDIVIAGLPSLFADETAQAHAAKAAACAAGAGAVCRNWKTDGAPRVAQKKAAVLTRADQLALLDRAQRDVPLHMEAELLSLNRSSL